jgi:LPXTG-motif cell wall-anchored protein
MQRKSRGLVVAIAIGLLGGIAGAAAAQSTSSSRTQAFEVVSVVGNQLVVKGPDGNKEYTVPETFRFTVDGKQLSVHELKAGMKGESTLTTITTVKPVYVTEERSAKVMQANGNSVILRSQDGKFKLFTQEDANKYKIQITRNGQPIEFQQLRANDLVSATFVTTKDEVLTEQQVNAKLAASPAPAAPMAAAPPPAAAKATPAPAAAPPPAAAPAASPMPKTLPKTASQLPLVGLVGALLLALGASLTMIRRRATR